MTETTTAPKATAREWIGLAVLALPCLLYSMDLTVLHLAIPAIAADLKPGASELLWIVDIYGFLLAGFLITMGTLGDRIGRRKLLLIGASAFGVASVLAAFSTSAEMLIVARGILGIAGATLAPSTLSLIRNMFLDEGQRTFAIGVWIASFSAGGALGPVIGGVMLAYFWWGSVFLIAVPVMLLLLAVGPKLLPEYRDPGAGRLDLVSAFLSLLAVLAVIYGVKRIAEDGVGWMPALSILAGLVVGLVFVLRQTRLADPLIDLRLFRRPTFSASLAVFIVGLFVAFGSFFFVAQYLQLVLGLTPLEAGLWTAPTGVIMIVGSMIAPLFVRRIRPAYVMAGGFVAVAAGSLVLTQVDGIATIMTGLVLLSIGFAPIGTLGTDLVVGSAPPERAGSAAAMSETSAELGGALGVAVLGSVVMAVYRSAMAGAVPTGVPPEAAEAARDTLGGAVAVAGNLPQVISEQLLANAREAFVSGFEVTAALSVAISALAAVMAMVLLRNAGPSGHSGEATDGAQTVETAVSAAPVGDPAGH